MTKREISKILRQLEKERTKNNENWMILFRMLRSCAPDQAARDFNLISMQDLHSMRVKREGQNKKISDMFETLLRLCPDTARNTITAICKQDRIITATARRLAK